MTEDQYDVCVECGKRQLTTLPPLKNWICNECCEREKKKIEEEDEAEYDVQQRAMAEEEEMAAEEERG